MATTINLLLGKPLRPKPNEAVGVLNLELLRLRLLKRVLRDLKSESDDHLALRKALLTLILMTQDDAGVPAQEFIKHLIRDFKPLTEHFTSSGHHPLFSKHRIARRLSEDGRDVLLAMDRKLVESVLGDPVNSKEIAVLGKLVPWEVTQVRYVGFFDIMGFRAFLERSGGDHERVYSALCDMSESAALAASMHAHGDQGLHPVLAHDGSQLRFVQFSDSIIALTRDSSAGSSALIELAAQMLFLNALRIGIGLRGAITKGTVTADFSRSIFFGRPIVDAFLLEEDQAWYGVVEHESAIDHGNGETLEELSRNDVPMTVTYSVPLKSSGMTDMQVINWPVFCESVRILDDGLEHLRNESSQKLHAYYQATRAFGVKMIEQFRL